MVMLTQLLRSVVVDEKQRSAPVADLCTSLLEDDYPPVTHVLFHHDGKLRKIEWKDVSNFDAKRRLVQVKDLDSSGNGDDDGVLLARDVMDALVLDLLARRTTRVCDLWLDEEAGALRLKGVDAGLEALLRRVARGWLPLPSAEALFDWKYIEFLRGDPSAVNSGAGYRLRINRLPAGEIARIADYVPYLHAAELLKLLPDEKAADVLQAMSVERQLQVIEELDEDDAIDLLQRMSPDLATDLVGRMHVDTMRRYVAKLPKKRREKIIELLRYPANSVGGLMVNDLIALRADLTVKEAQEMVGDRIKETEFVSLVFVVDEEPQGQLRGTISLRQLLAADPRMKLENLMDPYLETLDPYEQGADAAHRIVGGQLEAMPVTNSQGRLIGAMTISAAVSFLAPIAASRIRVFS
ncbi:MAG TPA: CBS domain-containing protein [Pyrinomonadaceae bacterium]|nr:CBS domain-containing protein [Pyrinomonadaceae bacterium]